MRKYLDTPKIDYVLTHLKLRCDISAELNQKLVFLQDCDLNKLPQDCLVFPLSKQERVLNQQVDDIPILYPVFPQEEVHYFEKKGSLVFTHDIFQQIFCLQTLYYETEITDKDKLGRVIPELTLNFKLGILHKPIVDYLFEIIIKALEDFCRSKKLAFRRHDLLPKHTFLLSHDVDRIETYSFYNTLNSLKIFLLKADKYNFSRMIKHFKEYFKFHKRANPLWDFPEMRDIEKEFELKSSYYFLNQGTLHQDAYYSLACPRILSLIKEIESDKHEIGLHLTIAGNKDEQIITKNLQKLNRVVRNKVAGVRSHWLRFEPGLTPDILEKLAIKYDTSIGHYSLEGFRAGTCMPYKLFSYAQNKTLNVWELPLIYMDCMILDYQNISQDQALQKLKEIVNEVIKFKGIFSLLWHNGNFSQTRPYNRKDFYLKLIKMILDTQPENLTAKSLVDWLEENK